jgi:hypothetical protein
VAVRDRGQDARPAVDRSDGARRLHAHFARRRVGQRRDPEEPLAATSSAISRRASKVFKACRDNGIETRASA